MQQIQADIALDKVEQDEKSFICDLCIARVRKRKNLEDICCVVCKKNAGFMKQEYVGTDAELDVCGALGWAGKYRTGLRDERRGWPEKS